MHVTTPNETGHSTPVRSSIDEDIRQDVAAAAWMMAAVTVPALAVLPFVL